MADKKKVKKPEPGNKLHIFYQNGNVSTFSDISDVVVIPGLSVKFQYTSRNDGQRKLASFSLQTIAGWTFTF